MQSRLQAAGRVSQAPLHGASAAERPLDAPPRWQGLKAKDAKFACRERAALLSTLYRGIELAVARGSCGLGPTVLG